MTHPQTQTSGQARFAAARKTSFSSKCSCTSCGSCGLSRDSSNGARAATRKPAKKGFFKNILNNHVQCDYGGGVRDETECWCEGQDRNHGYHGGDRMQGQVPGLEHLVGLPTEAVFANGPGPYPYDGRTCHEEGSAIPAQVLPMNYEVPSSSPGQTASVEAYPVPSAGGVGCGVSVGHNPGPGATVTTDPRASPALSSLESSQQQPQMHHHHVHHHIHIHQDPHPQQRRAPHPYHYQQGQQNHNQGRQQGHPARQNCQQNHPVRQRPQEQQQNPTTKKKGRGFRVFGNHVQTDYTPEEEEEVIHIRVSEAQAGRGEGFGTPSRRRWGTPNRLRAGTPNRGRAGTPGRGRHGAN